MPVIVEDSINGQRYHYLDGVSLSEQLQFRRLAEHEGKKKCLFRRKRRVVMLNLDWK